MIHQRIPPLRSDPETLVAIPDICNNLRCTDLSELLYIQRVTSWDAVGALLPKIFDHIGV